MINQRHKDYLNEIVNICMSHAAKLLSDMLNQKVHLNIPFVELITGKDIEKLKDNPNFSFLFKSGVVLSSTLNFGLSFSGKASFMFPAKHAKKLVSICLGEELDEESLSKRNEMALEQQLIDADYDVLQEISNVLLNSVVGEFGHFLDSPLEYSLPSVDLVEVTESDDHILFSDNVFLLVFHTAFDLAESQIKGTILMTIGLDSANKIIEKIDEILGDAHG
jgi:chemotaxis protein CheC